MPGRLQDKKGLSTIFITNITVPGPDRDSPLKTALPRENWPRRSVLTALLRSTERGEERKWLSKPEMSRKASQKRQHGSWRVNITWCKNRSKSKGTPFTQTATFVPFEP